MPRGRPRTSAPGEHAQQGAKFRALVKQDDYTLSALASLTGLSAAMLYRLEVGTTLPSPSTKAALGRVFGEEAIRQVGWARANSPLNKTKPAKAAPPGSLGDRLKTLRLALPGPPDQSEMAGRLGIKERAYRYLESGGGGKRLRPELLERLLEVHGQSLLDFIRDA